MKIELILGGFILNLQNLIMQIAIALVKSNLESWKPIIYETTVYASLDGIFHSIQNNSNIGDYPGVSSIDDLDFYKSNCPDPNLLLRID